MKRWIVGTLATVTLGAGGTGALVAADRAQDPYLDKSTHYELPITSDIHQGERVEISKTEAAMTLYGWADEYAITIKPQIPTVSFKATNRDFKVNANRPLFSKRMEYKASAVTAFIEPKEGTENEFDIDFTLDTKPDTNVFEYKIEGAEEFDFFYQPELTQEEIDEGAERPDNVVGSYAVYHKTKANHRVGSTNYAVGKIMHIYRPKVIDANGAEVWAELNYDNGTLSVTVPQKSLDEAVYPVRVDPTFGYTSIGASNDNIAMDFNNNAYRIGTVFSLSEVGNLSSISAGLSYSIDSSSDTVDITVFANTQDGGGAGTHTQITQIETTELSISGLAGNFYTFTASSEALSVSNIILSALGNGADLVTGDEEIRLHYDASAETYYSELTSPDYAKENPWTATASSNRTYSIYATYTASGGGGGAAPIDVTYFEIID